MKRERTLRLIRDRDFRSEIRETEEVKREDVRGAEKKTIKGEGR